MNILNSNLVRMVILVLSIGICLSMKIGVAKADVAIKGQTQGILRVATIKTKKVLKVPDRSAQKKKKETEIRLSRGETLSKSISTDKTSSKYISAAGKSNLISYAYNFIGIPYVWGGEGPRFFDCSGFTMYVYKKFGVDLPHYTGSQIGKGISVSRNDLKQGDLIFFNTNGTASHVGIYVGDGDFIHASSGSNKVTVSNLSQSYYNTRFASARRIFN
ncbi:C40 family peptidase [Clostridium sp.]|jgi:cell wall-associated NlpC family hydrolase|uniref:C40 family peptidase n=1 Tax=Clostridium sp. TaxID=1506 RepID=UPI003EEF7A31